MKFEDTFYLVYSLIMIGYGLLTLIGVVHPDLNMIGFIAFAGYGFVLILAGHSSRDNNK